MEAASAQGVAVVIEAQHLCMMMRGVEKQNSLMTTSSMLGSMLDAERSAIDPVFSCLATVIVTVALWLLLRQRDES